MTDLSAAAGGHGGSSGGCSGGCSEGCALAGLRRGAGGTSPGPGQGTARAIAARRVTVTVEGHGSASVSTDERVLVALERARGLGELKGLPRRLPVGCRRGGCGVCRARVIAGDYRRAPMSREHVSPADEADGFVLTCAIYAQSDLMLRLDAPVLPGKRAAGRNDQPDISGSKTREESNHGPNRRS